MISKESSESVYEELTSISMNRVFLVLRFKRVRLFHSARFTFFNLLISKLKEGL